MGVVTFPLGLKALVISAVALVTSASGYAVQSTPAASPVAAIAPQVATSTVAPDPGSDDLLRAAEVSRSQTRSALDSRAAKLAAQARAIEARDHFLKAEAARKVAKKKAAAEAHRTKWGFAQGTQNPRDMARQMMETKYGWGDTQFACYNNIIIRESNWITTADNPTSSAYGIPQALPGKRMASAGADWRTNPATQISWGLGYVKERFGTPCAAWSFKRSHGWY